MTFRHLLGIMSLDLPNFGKRGDIMSKKISLKAARVNENIKQVQAAKAVGVSVATLSNWENHKTFPRVDQLYTLCDYYKTPVDDIFLPVEFS